MTLTEFLADPDVWLGQEVTVETAWLHSDGVAWVCLSDAPRFERELVADEAPWVARWLRVRFRTLLAGSFLRGQDTGGIPGGKRVRVTDIGLGLDS
jgi:hypothetical protein